MQSESPTEVPRTPPPPLAIVGMGCLFPKAPDLKTYWANIRAGVDCIEDIPRTHWNPADYFDADPRKRDHTYAARGGFLPVIDFRPLDFGITPSAIEATDTSQLLGLVAAKQALDDAGYGGERSFDRSRTSVILGVTGALELVIPLGARLGHPLWRKALAEFGIDPTTANQVVDRISKGYVEWQENSFPGLLGNVVAGRIANRLDLGGTNCVVDAACASSLSALHLAALELQAGLADMVVTGGVDTFNDIFMYMCFSKTPALSPTGSARPFAADGDGTILGEGLGMLVVKRHADALRDGDRVYAILRSIGSSSDGKGNAIYAPSSAGQKKALRNAYRLAGVEPESIALVEAHGTGTKVGDAAELAALTEVYREAGAEPQRCAVGSVKSQIGHTKAAAGAAGVIKAALALYHKVLPPSVKVERPLDLLADEASPFYLNAVRRPWARRPQASQAAGATAAAGWEPRRAAVSAFGFGGSNFHCVLEEATGVKAHVDWSDDIEIVALSALDDADLRRQAEAVAQTRTWDELQAHAAQSRATFAAAMNVRMAFVVDRGDFLGDRKIFASVRRALDGSAIAAGGGAPVFLAKGRPGKLAAVFPGQGAQYLGMGRDWTCRFPEMLAALEAAVVAARSANPAAFRNILLSDAIDPPTTFSQATAAMNDARLRQTDVAQPALAAVEWGMFETLKRFGISFDAFIGHSFGELPALCAAGAFDFEQLMTLACQRGQLMASAAGPNAGAMLAVQASPQAVAETLGDLGAECTIANKNGPRQTVLSGSSEAIAEAERQFQARKLPTTRLQVAAAFHSPLVAGAAAQFKEVLAGIELKPLRGPVYANTTGQPYPSDPAAIRTLLGNQLARPVEFAASIEAMTAAGVSDFVEIGPGARLTRLLSASAGGRALAVDASEGRGDGMLDLAKLLARLAALGHAVDLRPWNAGADPVGSAAQGRRPPPDGQHGSPEHQATNGKPAFSVRLSGANFVPEERRAVWNPVPAALNGVGETLPRPARRTSEIVPAPARASAAGEPLHAKPLPAPPVQEAESPQSRSALPVQSQQRAAQAEQGKPSNGAQPSAGPKLPQDQGAESMHNDRSMDNAGGAANALQPLAGDSEVRVPIAATMDAIELIQRNLDALRRMQEQTSQVHLRYLEGQQAALTAFHGLAEAQNRVWQRPAQALAPTAPVAEPAPQRPAAIAAPTRYTDQSTQAFSPPAAGQAGRPQPIERPIEIPAPRAAQPTAPIDGSAELVDGILAIVAEKTGYPAEMLELDMQLDADLGIDSIKRVEILSAVQERFPNLPAIAADQIGALRTLREVVGQLNVEQSSPLKSPQGPTTVARPAAAIKRPNEAALGGEGEISTGGAKTAFVDGVLAIVAEKTGYPVGMLELDMQLDADLGIDSIKRVEILAAVQERFPQAPTIESDQLGSLRTLREVVARVGVVQRWSAEPAAVHVSRPATACAGAAAAAPAADPAALTRYIVEALPLAPAAARPALALCRNADILIIGQGHGRAAKVAAELTRRGHSVAVASPEQASALAPPRRLAGLVIVAPAAGVDRSLLSSALQAARRCCAALAAGGRAGGSLFATIACQDGEFGFTGRAGEAIAGALAGLAKTAAREWPATATRALDATPDVPIEMLVDELLASGPVETGLCGDKAVGLRLVEHSLDAAMKRSEPLAAGDVVIITGGARGVTAAAARALAAAFRPRLVLLGRTPLDPAAEPAWQAALASETDLKRALASHMPAGTTPKQIGKRAQAILAQREIRSTLAALAELGAIAEYANVDVRDRAAVHALIEAVEARLGPIAGVVHGAGVLADRRIEDKSPEEFDAVFGVKVDGFVNLLAALAERPLKVLAAFSSTTARLGRVGQSDYAMANEAVNKLAQVEQARRPACKVVAANWGPWAGGMVGPELEKRFAAEGIGLIGLESGGQALVDELRGNGPVEVIFVGSKLPEAETTLRVAPKPSADESTGAAIAFEKAFEREVDLATHSILEAHIFDGRPVLPLALAMEWLAHAALHVNPGLTFHGLDNVRVAKRLSLDPNRRLWIEVHAARAARRDGLYWAPVELRARHAGGPTITYVEAAACLAETLPTSKPTLALPAGDAYPWTMDRVYEQYLFHGPPLRAVASIAVCDRSGVVAKLVGSPPPEQWLAMPLRNDWLADPMALDGAFQLAIVWSFETYGIGSLPTGLARYRQFCRRFPKSGVRAIMAVKRHSAKKAVFDIEWLDADGQLVARIDDYECTLSESLKQAFQANRPALVEQR